MRYSAEDYDKIKLEYGVDRVWSFSKLQTYVDHKYEYFLKYIKKERGDQKDSIYTECGNLCHDILERYSNGQIQQSEMQVEFDNGFLDLMMKGKCFDRSDEQANEKLKNNYEECLRNFFINYEAEEIPSKTEMPVNIFISKGKVLVGFIDFVSYKDNILYITDYKTSSIYTGADLEEKSKQLLLYSEGLRQKLKLSNFDSIVPQFNFLKYVTVEYEQLNGIKKSRNIERNQIGVKLKSIIKTYFNQFKNEFSENEINFYLEELEINNNLNNLPEKIKNKFKINNCIIKIKINDSIINNLKINIENIIENIEKEEKIYENNKDDKIFWEEINKKDLYYCSNLSEYSWKLYLPYKEYLIKNGLLNNILRDPDTSAIPITQPNELDKKWKDLFGD